MSSGPRFAFHWSRRLVLTSFSPRDRNRNRIRIRNRNRIRIRNRNRVRIRNREGGEIPILREKSLHPRRILEKSLPRRSRDEDAFERRA